MSKATERDAALADRDEWKDRALEAEKERDELKSRISVYEDSGLSPEQISAIIKTCDGLIRDSVPFEADKIQCHIGQLRHIKSFTSAERSKPQ